MNDVEAALKDKKKELDGIEAPAELEARLRQALQGGKRRVVYKPVAAALIAVLLLTYGRGQEIGRSYTFSNGVEVTIDGIMFDENELVAFYKVHSSSGKLQDILNYNLPRLHVEVQS